MLSMSRFCYLLTDKHELRKRVFFEAEKALLITGKVKRKKREPPKNSFYILPFYIFFALTLYYLNFRLPSALITFVVLNNVDIHAF